MGHQVLVVEDSRVVNDLVADTLRRRGYGCTQTYDGLQALKRFEVDQPDALVLDLNIPKLHGLDVLRHVKGQRPFTVVVVLTGHGSEQTAMQALKLGADDYLTKPFRESVLLDSLETHLQRADLQKCLVIEGGWPAGLEERYLAQVFYDAPAALIHVDESDTVRAVNRATARLLARAPEEILGGDVTALAVEGIRSGWLATVRREAETPKGYEGEVHLVGAAGPFPVHVMAVERPEPGHLIFALRDLRHQKAMEERYFESKKLASLGRVVEGVAHEVRNPLISIGGFARKLQGSFPGDAAERRYAEVIVAEVERLEQMVRDIEDYVQFSKQHRLEFVCVALPKVLEDALGSAKALVAAAGIRVRFLAPEETPAVYADPGLLAELFEGILKNACEAMPEGGDLGIRLRVVDNWVQTQIEDTGRGIPEEDLEEIFDPFFTSKTAGAGLGLAKAYLIVEEHAGTIDFESRVGQGTCCTVSLPIDRRRVPRMPA